jgi:hypothetical protein
MEEDVEYLDASGSIELDRGIEVFGGWRSDGRWGEADHKWDLVGLWETPSASNQWKPSRRDYFAAAALAGMCVKGGWDGNLAEKAYIIADSMIRAGERL